MKRIWIYFSNTFEIITRKAFRKMLKIGNDHDSRLNGDKGDEDILTLWTFFNPLLLVYRSLFSAWQTAFNTRVSLTLILTDTFKLLGSDWIKSWEGKVHNFFPVDSPTDKAIFPKRRTPFQVLSYEERIIAVNTLAATMAAYPDLNDVKKDVEEKYLVLVRVRDEQKQAMQIEEKRVNELEKQRIVLANALFKNMASLMVKYFENPTQGERFFDLTLIRRPGTDSDSSFTQNGILDMETSAVLVIPKKFTLSIGTNFIFANSGGGGELHCFFAASASATDSPNKAIVLPGETTETTAGEMGWSATNTMLIVRNVGALTAEYEVTGAEATEN